MLTVANLHGAERVVGSKVKGGKRDKQTGACPGPSGEVVNDVGGAMRVAEGLLEAQVSAVVEVDKVRAGEFSSGVFEEVGETEVGHGLRPG